MLLRFIVGQSIDAGSELSLKQEQESYGDLWRIPLRVTQPSSKAADPAILHPGSRFH